jgi:heat shock protein HtpX
MYSAIAENKRKTWLIIAVFVLLIGGLGLFVSQYIFGQPYITVAVVIGAIIYSIVMYFNAGKVAVTMHGAKEVTAATEPRLYNTVENLSIATGMAMPKVYVIEDAGLNAFATGRDPEHAIVAATRGLLNAMDNTELEGVMAHELGHVRNYDIRVSMIVMGLALVVSLIADWSLRALWWGGGRDRENNNGMLQIVGIVGLFVAPLVAKLIQAAVSRQREFLADATGAETTRYPEGLARALLKLQGGASRMQSQNSATAHLFIANPLRGKALAQAFSTHPKIEDRVTRLRGMSF